MSAEELARRVRDAAQRVRAEIQRKLAIEREREQSFRDAMRSLFEAIPGGTWREQ